MLILLPRAAVVVLLLLVLPLLLLLVMPATVAAAGFDVVEKDRLPVLLVLRRTALAPVDVAKAANCLVGRSTEVSMACVAWPACCKMMRWWSWSEEVDELSAKRTRREKDKES